ncbi:hypothetical protein PR048_018068 [Dryococelus australis]|uniref:C2H2-type domain-containing protein n=1 Tax=Dryococelus australis TaxID=614101 RepID=A0ABQ9HBD5_9NEOP|nr:hypothetical protein PR048_018068 [Dryococelus australis]
MLDVKQEEIEVSEDNPVEAHDGLVTADPLDVPAGRNRKSPVQEDHHFYNSAILLDDNGSAFECENEGEIDFMRVNHGGAISVQGLFDSSESAAVVSKPIQPKKKRRIFKRITFKKKKKKSPPIWTPQEVRMETHHGYVCRKCGESFPELWLLKSHEKSHGSAENVCTICEKRFSSKGCLVRHIRLHTRQMPYSCAKCSTSFANKSAYLQHRQTSCSIEEPPPLPPEAAQTSPDKQENKLSCYICQEMFPSVNQLIQHRKGHVNYSCPKCKKHFTGGKALSNHLRVHKLGAIMAHKMVHAKAPPAVLPVPAIQKTSSCSVCNKVFPSVGLMHRHMVKHTKLKQFTCNICHTSMGYATSLRKHMKSMHNINIDHSSIKPDNIPSNDVPSQQDPPPLVIKSEALEVPAETADGQHVCNICNKVFSQKSLLVNHVKVIHMGMKAYKCTTCGKMFTSKPHLVRHMKTHKESQFALTCKICCKKFLDVKTYNKHKGVHTRYRCYTCGICSESFNGINSWRAHQVTHLPDIGHAPMMNIAKQEIQTSTGKYTCRLCFKMYRSRAELYEHKKMHIKLKIYSCTECKNSYNSLSTLMKHKRREHSSDEQYFDMGLMSDSTHDCDFCGKSFGSSSSLSKHKLVHAELLYANVTRMDPPVRRRVLKTSETVDSASPVLPSDPFLCVPCNRSFTDLMSLKTHRGWHKRKHNSPFSMLQLKAFSTQSPPKAPVSPPKAPVSPPKVPVGTPIKEVFNSPSSAKAFPDDSFWCVECNKGFKKSVNLARHFKLSQRHNMKVQGQAESINVSPTKDGSDIVPVEVQLLVQEETDNDASEVLANDSAADSASADSVSDDAPAVASNSASDGTSADDSVLSEEPTKDSSTALMIENGAPTENYSVDDTHTNNCSMDDALANNHTVEDAPANNCSVNDSCEEDTSEHASAIVCFDDTVNDSYAGDVPADESTLENLPQVETFQGNGTESSNAKIININRQRQVFECQLCSKVFKNKIALVRHKGWHSRSPSARLKSNVMKLVPKGRPVFDTPATTDLSSPTVTQPIPTPPYTCLTCGMPFSSASSLSKHKRLHLSPTPTAPVSRCLRPKESVRPPDRMLPELEVQGAFRCSTCKKYYSSVKSLYKHQRLHARKPLTAFAKQLPGAHAQLAVPVRDLSKRLIPTKFHCNMCGLYYSSAVTLYKHKRRHERYLNATRAEEAATPPVQIPAIPALPERKVRRKYRCEICLQFYSCSSNLYRHRRLHLDQQQVLPVADFPGEVATVFPSQDAGTPPPCEQPPVQCVARQQVQTPYQCDVCKKFYSCSTSLNKHRRLHAVRPLPLPAKNLVGDPPVDEASTNFSCPYCSKTFSKQFNLNMHVRCHTGERPYVCDLCPQAFTRYNALWKHKKRMHLNWTYTCTTCGRLFPFKNVLNMHIRKVHQFEPKKAFRLGGMGAKKLKVSGMGNFPCGECSKSFVYLGALLTHERMYHGK